MAAHDGRAESLQTGQVLLGRRLREIRQEHGLLIRDVASASGLSESYLSTLERGQRLASLDTLVGLSTVYGMLPVDMLAGVYPFGERRKPRKVTPATDARRR